MSTDPKTTIGNVCFIINEVTSKILLLKRNHYPMKDLYTGVGGKTHYKEDIHSSCIREVEEETGLDLTDLQLKAVIKTILEGDAGSSWILFVYVGKTQSMEFKTCEEGTLEWIDETKLTCYDLIGFIREILPYVLRKNQFLEGTIYHNLQGNVKNKTLTLSEKTC